MKNKLKYLFLLTFALSTTAFAIVPVGFLAMESAIATSVRSVISRVGFAANDPRYSATVSGIYSKLAQKSATGLTVGDSAYLFSAFGLTGILALANGDNMSWATSGLLTYTPNNNETSDNPEATGTTNYCLTQNNGTFCSTKYGENEFFGQVTQSNPNKPDYTGQCHPDPSFGCITALPTPEIGFSSPNLVLYVPFGYINESGATFLQFHETYVLETSTLPEQQTCQNTKDGECYSFPVQATTLSNVTPEDLIASLTPEQLSEEIPSEYIADYLDETWQQIAGEPGYEGFPYSFSNPLSSSDVATASQPLTVQDFLTSGNVSQPSGSNSPTVEQSPQTDGTINPKPNPDAQQINLGADPGIGQPDLSIPTIEAILQPILGLLSPYHGSNFQDLQGQCTLLEFDALGIYSSTDLHCQLFEDSKPIIFIMMTIFWLFSSIRIVLEA